MEAEAISDEWARYREKALRALKRGRPAPEFASAVLPHELHGWVAEQLTGCTTADEARVVFDEARRREQRAADAEDDEADDDEQPHHTGVMVALMLAPETATQLRAALPDDLPGALPPSEYHVTLTYNGDIADDVITEAELDALRAAVEDYVSNATTGPLTGSIAGFGMFQSDEGSDEEPVIATVNIKGLQAFRAGLFERLCQDDVPPVCQPSDTFEYTPHITLAYLPRDEENPVERVPNLPLRFAQVTVAAGDDRQAYRIGGRSASAKASEASTRAVMSEARRYAAAIALDEVRSLRAEVLAQL